MDITGTTTAERRIGRRLTLPKSLLWPIALWSAAAAAQVLVPSQPTQPQQPGAKGAKPGRPSAMRAAPGRTNAASRTLQFVPQISIGVAQTNNLTLVADNREAQTVLELIPSFTLTQDAPRLTANAAYRLEGYRYQQRHDSHVSNLFDGAFSVGMQPSHFFFDFGANRTQSVRDPRQPIPRSNLPISTNLVDRDEYYGGPRLHYIMGTNVSVDASYRHSWVKYKQGQSASTPFNVDLKDSAANFSMDNYRKLRGFTWAVRYEGLQTNYQQFPSFKYRQASAEIGSWVGSKFRLFASGGRESPWDQPSVSALQDNFWEAGFATKTGGRFNGQFAAGERTFGASRRGTFTYSLRHGTTSLNYNETPETTGLNRYSRGSLLQPTEPNDFLTQPGSAERYISKRLQWNWTMDLRRTGFAVTVFNESRKQRTQADGTPLPDEAQSGGNLSVSWAVGPRTDFVLSGERSRREFGAGDQREYTLESIAANRRIGGRTVVSMEYAYTKDDSLAGVSALNYTAGLISVTLTRTFSKPTNEISANR